MSKPKKVGNTVQVKAVPTAEQTKRMADKVTDIIVRKPEFNEVYAKHLKGVLTLTVKEMIGTLTDEERAEVAAVGDISLSLIGRE